MFFECLKCCWPCPTVFCKDFPGQNVSCFYDQIKQKTDNSFHSLNKPIQTKETYWTGQFLGNQVLGSLQLAIGCSRVHLRITYVWHGSILRTIYTYIILLSVFLRNELNDFSNDTLWVFIWFLSDFCLEFCFNLSEGTKKFFFIEVVFFIIFILEICLEPPSVSTASAKSFTFDIAIASAEQCLISRFYLD